MLLSTTAEAHPHAYIDMEVQVIFDATAQISALRQTWLLDAQYSAQLTQGLAFKSKEQRTPEQMTKIAQVMITNLSRFAYLTHASAAQRNISFGFPTDIAANFKGTRFELAFTLPLAQPVKVDHQPFSYAVYDPSYYIEMLHAEQSTAIQLLNAPIGCKHTLQAPKPDPAQLAKAAALDRAQTAGNELGVFFAERVIIRCDAVP